MLMKRLFILLFVAMTTIGANAQTYWGYLTKNVDGYKKGEGIMYQKSKNGRIQLPGGAEYGGNYPPTIVKFSGYYMGAIIDQTTKFTCRGRCTHGLGNHGRRKPSRCLG